jgi:hypothetical protein
MYQTITYIVGPRAHKLSYYIILHIKKAIKKKQEPGMAITLCSHYITLRLTTFLVIWEKSNPSVKSV